MLTNLVPDAERLSHVFSQAAAPAFFLGAVAGFLSILLTRLADVMGRLRTGDPAHPGNNPVNLLLRARILHSAISLTLAGGICTTVLLAISFMGAFAQIHHVYGAGMLFLVATVLIGGALYRFFQEVRVGLRELNLYTDKLAAGRSDTAGLQIRNQAENPPDAAAVIEQAPADTLSGNSTIPKPS